MTEKTKIYFAAPLFSEPDRDYNVKVYNRIMDELGDRVDIYLPQDNPEINDKTAYANSIAIANADYEYLNKSDVMIALIDGASTDVGVALEVGIAFEKRMPIIGLYTDVRQQGTDNQQKLEALQEIGENQFDYKNLMLTGVIKISWELVNNIDDLINELKRLVDLDEY